MKAFCLKSPGVVGYCDVPEPSLQGSPFGAIIHPVAVAPCSSDVHTAFGGGSPKAPNLVFGHESIGEVVEVGEYVKDFKVGDFVAIPAITPDWREVDIQNGNYGHAGAHFSGHKLGRSEPGVFAEKFLVRDADTTLAHITSDISRKQALMSVDVVTTGFTGAEAANIKLGDTVCVIGIGPIGLMAVAGAKLLGAARIIAVGTRPKCVELARYYGATDVISYRDGDIVEQVLEEDDIIQFVAGSRTESVLFDGSHRDRVHQKSAFVAFLSIEEQRGSHLEIEKGFLLAVAYIIFAE